MIVNSANCIESITTPSTPPRDYRSSRCLARTALIVCRAKHFTLHDPTEILFPCAADVNRSDKTISRLKIMEPIEFAIILGIAFPIVWFVGLYVMATFGPWSRLTKRYPHNKSVTGTSYWFVSLAAGWFSYSNCLTAVANRDYLTLRIILPFRLFHPPVSIPRSAVSHVTKNRFLFVSSVTFQLRNHELRLFGRVAESAFWQSPPPK